MNEAEQKIIEQAWCVAEGFYLHLEYFDDEEFQKRLGGLMTCLKEADEERFKALLLQATRGI